jgi:hypothetical protein
MKATSLGDVPAATRQWVLLAYRMPREPSTPRIAVWRKLRRLGVLQLLDGLVALPADASTKEHLEWIADEIVAGGGEADIWLAHPATKSQERALASRMASDLETEYDAIVAEAGEAAALSAPSRRRAAARLRRELSRMRQRDHFPRRGFERAASAIDRLEETTDARGSVPR